MGLNAKWDDFTRRGQAWDSFWTDAPSTETHSGSGSLSTSVSLAATGRKAAAGILTLTTSAALVAAAVKGGRGAGGVLAVVTSMSASGRDSESGGGFLVTTVVLAAAGRKDVSSGPLTMVLEATLEAEGSNPDEEEAPLHLPPFYYAATYDIEQPPPPAPVGRPKEAFGFGVMKLTAILEATGVATNDDDEALALLAIAA